MSARRRLKRKKCPERKLLGARAGERRLRALASEIAQHQRNMPSTTAARTSERRHAERLREIGLGRSVTPFLALTRWPLLSSSTSVGIDEAMRLS